MLDNETKKRIDEARDILVGKVPDPKSQVEQITIALIYKFMDDMDKEAIDFGGTATFFTGEYEKYAWTKIFDPKLGGHEMLNLYGEAIVKLNQNPNIPQLFRDIFKNAYLPYRDPETLKMFLKTINDFKYDHSEMLGDAFEYLLSVMGSQGDAGQFRTPRHIIDFIVQILEPKKNESICDPACGTAGFLISSYKYIVEQNSKKAKGDLLTPDDRKKLMQNFVGYDISPDMVRLSLVNMYLHGFTTPKISEYDTLTSEEKWNEYFDVILANPPFMTPKGGIKPHKKFTIKANRSEVLFVDYIMEHINPSTGRAAIIVPDGIIFKNDTAYKSLRKSLVETKHLYAVISLHNSTFEPYCGVKTSILILDSSIAKKSKDILFIKIENDGYSLNKQRYKIDNSDLNEVTSFIVDYKRKITIGEKINLKNPNFTLVAKTKIAENGNYQLSNDRYTESEYTNFSKYPLVKLKDLFVIERGGSPRPIKDFITNDENGINWIKIGDAKENSKYITETKEKIRPEGASRSRMVYEGDFILSNSMSFGRPYIMKTSGCIHDGWLVLKPKSDNISHDFLYIILSSDNLYNEFKRNAIGGVVNNLNIELVKNVSIPLPPVEIQKEIVAKYEIRQKNIERLQEKIELEELGKKQDIENLWQDLV